MADVTLLKKKVSLLEQLLTAQKQLDKATAVSSTPTPQPLAGANTNYSSGNLDTIGAARGNEFAPAFEAAGGVDQKNGGGSIAGTLDYRAGQSGSAGESLADAKKRAMKLQQEQQMSAGTSYAFNPETMGKVKKTNDQIQLQLTDISNSPWKSQGTKQDMVKSALESGARQIASLFGSQQEFDQAITSNPQLIETLNTFNKLGGKVEDISSKIQPTQMPDIAQNTQSTGDYLSSLNNPQANKTAETTAINELFPERQIMQEQIAQTAQIPKDIMKLYFGTEDQTGLMQQKKMQAEEEIRIIEQKEKNADNSLRADAQLAIQKNDAEVRVEQAKVEENRLAARNYMTGMLAKLGALTTTGAAPLALQTLETKYQNQSQNLALTYSWANKEIENKLVSAIATKETDADEKILLIEQDLTKDYETVMKEVMRVQQASQKEILAIKEKYATELRTRTTKYTDDLKAAAEKNTKEWALIASGGIDFTSGGLPTSKSRVVSTTEQKLEASRGNDGYVNSGVYAQAYQEWIKKGGTATSFIAKFPPKLYANPNDKSLPPNLSYARESQTISSKDTGGFEPLFGN
jgi:hypothetical protein